MTFGPRPFPRSEPTSWCVFPHVPKKPITRLISARSQTAAKAAYSPVPCRLEDKLSVEHLRVSPLAGNVSGTLMNSTLLIVSNSSTHTPV